MKIVNIDGKTILVKVGNEDLQNGEFHIQIGVASIGNYAFFNCTGLTSITIPDSVTSIGHEAFVHCTGLTSITIPDSVTSIGNYAFVHCTGLTGITIPASVISIGYDAFAHCTGLTSITIPASVTSIGHEAFDGCTGLTSIRIPASVTSIGIDVFARCTRLTSITIPSSVTSIADGAFAGCSVTRIIIKTDDYKEIERIRNLLPKNLQNCVISGKVFQCQQEILNKFCFHFPSTETVAQLRRLNPQMHGIVATFDSRDYAGYHGLDRALLQVPVPPPTGNEAFDAYKNQLEQLLNKHMNLYKGITKLKSYIQILEKEIPIGFLNRQQKQAKNPGNIEILQTRILAKKILSHLTDHVAFKFSPADRDLLEKKPELMAILTALPGNVHKKTRLLEDCSESREMKVPA